MMSVAVFLAQATADWSPVPYLSIATILALGSVAAVFGILKNRTDTAERTLEKFDERLTKRDDDFRTEIRQLREEQAQQHKENRADMERIRENVADIYRAMGRSPDRPRGYRP